MTKEEIIDLYQQVKEGVDVWGEFYIPDNITWARILIALQFASEVAPETNKTPEKDPYPELVNIDLSGYLMDDYQSSVEFDDWLARWFEAEYGRVPKNYDYDEEELNEQFITISNIKW